MLRLLSRRLVLSSSRFSGFCPYGCRTASSTSAGEVEHALSVQDVADAMGALDMEKWFQRKPWSILDDTRGKLEQKLGVGTDELLLAMQRWATDAFQTPTCVGLAHVSGNVYFGPAMPAAALIPTHTLVASLFSHGEIGLEAFVPASQDAECHGIELALFEELSTWSSLRWLQPEKQVTQRPSKPENPGRRKKRLAAHPLASVLWGASDTSPSGDLLAHENFHHLEVEGEQPEEIQLSLAKSAAGRAYTPPLRKDNMVLAGCALRLGSDGELFAGSLVRTSRGIGALSPVQIAIVSILANGRHPGEVQKGVWVAAEESADTNRLRQVDANLFKYIAKQASFEASVGL
eukprot:gnl/MRDRNA2_/MRDRNA2_140469_c0_seq1.p1 gnl/MRDRNA2_/MRDRNA2_140469_c0~~gnl/MRDRNA2_/MRDRNA2_140469_c0_seq1.p1  ORF type:complete len:347 (+),score=54.66 gnl/MRDRNA2_/MRDRNA2_140469_c0_seq1:54-1094(+)